MLFKLKTWNYAEPNLDLGTAVTFSMDALPFWLVLFWFDILWIIIIMNCNFKTKPTIWPCILEFHRLINKFKSFHFRFVRISAVFSFIKQMYSYRFNSIREKKPWMAKKGLIKTYFIFNYNVQAHFEQR